MPSTQDPYDPHLLSEVKIAQVRELSNENIRRHRYLGCSKVIFIS